LTRRWGWTADNVSAMEVITADGHLVRASDEENRELLWGLRGGGGNFGVVTGIEYNLYRVGPEVVGGVVAWPASEAPAVLEFYRKQAESAPPELTLVSFMRPAPPAPWLPKDMHGQPIVAILACYSGRLEEGEKVVAPIKAVWTSRWRRAGPPALHADAGAARCHAAEGPPLLLEERIPAQDRVRPD
jgi:FAD/FMN-containing dehydrogenase